MIAIPKKTLAAMDAMPEKAFDALEKRGGKTSRLSRNVKVEKAAPPVAVPEPKAPAVTEAMSEANTALISKLVDATEKIVAANAKRAPVPYRFDIKRDKDGAMKSITATPIGSEK